MSGDRLACLPEGERRRTGPLLERFRRVTGRPATFVVRAPGRVNLLGEHTDYNGLPVLPMAIDRSVLTAGRPRADQEVWLFNSAPEFSPRHYRQAGSIPPGANGDWGNYSKAAAQGLMRNCGEQLRYGADLVVHGDIPRGAGLSSSSALVVANALALLAANDVEMPYAALAELLPQAEQYVGTLSGGMDQATSLLAQAGYALRIDFSPLRVRTVPLPGGYSVVVCHSLVPAEKSGAAREAYNLRVIECRLACRVLERALGGSLPRPLRAFGDLSLLFPHRPLLDFLSHLAAYIPDRPLRLAEVADLIGASPERLRSDCGVQAALGDQFSLLRRARHVLTEAVRVEQAEDALHAADALAFGQLMDASHASCRDDYEISCTELEELVKIAKEAGALGSRLTGAGFGGCTVNLVADSVLSTFLRRVDRHFYCSRLSPAARVGDHRFVFRPQGGAVVMRL
ncbi:MAG: galactokinase [Candidatus Binatia bacterium]